MISKMSAARAITLITIGVVAAACSADSSTKPLVNPTMTIVRGAGLTDTIQASVFEAIVAEVRGADGKIAPGVAVHFEVPRSNDPARPKENPIFVCNLAGVGCNTTGTLPRIYYDTTDADGRVEALVRLGTLAGRIVVRLNAVDLGLTDSAVFNVKAGNRVRIRALSTDTSVNLGSAITVGAQTFDRYNNPRSDPTTITAGIGNSISVTPAGVVNALDIGEQWLFVRSGSLVDSTLVRAVPSARLVAWDQFAQAVRIFNSNGSDKRTLVSNIWTSIGVYPHFEMSRRQVLMYGTNISTTNFTLIDTTGTPRRDFTEGLGLRAIQAVRLLADGAVLVVSWGTTPGEYQLFRVNTDNTTTVLRNLPGLLSDAGGHADISLDGKRLVYQAYTNSPAGRELRVMNIATGDETVVTPNGNAPRWSPTGDRILYIEPGLGTATIINADGTGKRKVGSTVFSAGLAWSPDGTHIIGRSESTGQLRIIRLNDLAGVTLQFRAANGSSEGYFQPDWR